MAYKVQYILDEKGEKSSVVLSLKQWELIQRKLHKQEILLGLEPERDEISEQEGKLAKKKLFLEALEGLKEIKSFHAIEDAVAWQRAQRDEWE
jgi:hypothetical protein